ncbi:MAG: hypothetical protein R3182_12300, partial [Draconibacterium sp.]|nr:hypothetical protein [Draconibacterium sp.]
MKPKIQILLLFISVVIVSCSTKESANIPLPEHPRPNFERSVWQNLNGTWQFKPDSANVGLDENWQSEAEFFDQNILVPFSWASPTSGITLPNVHVGWYSRSFTIENHKLWEGKDAYLNFMASDFNTSVWLNGKKVGDHSGGYTPFDFNISDQLQDGENQLVVRVEDEELRNRPSGKQYYGNAKGIWQTMYLEARSKNHITGIFFTPDIDKKEVGVRLDLASETKSETEFILYGSDIDFKSTIPVGKNEVEFDVSIPNMKLWDLDNPYLYEVNAALNGEEIVDEVEAEIEKEVEKAGEEALFDLGLGSMHPDLIKHVGMLKYRTS